MACSGVTPLDFADSTAPIRPLSCALVFVAITFHVDERGNATPHSFSEEEEERERNERKDFEARRRRELQEDISCRRFANKIVLK